MYTNEPTTTLEKTGVSTNPDLIDDIAKFHEKFSIPQRAESTPIDPDLMRFRLKFLAEELKEANIAAAESNLPDFLDALVDLVYVAIGTAHVFNLDFATAWASVQEANMKKVNRSEENPGKRGHSSDIVKPAGWVAPNHEALFTKDDLSWAPLKDEPEKGMVDLPSFMAA